jgi:hypothetical protein
MTAAEPNPAATPSDAAPADGSDDVTGVTAARDLATLSAIEVVGLHAADLMTAAAVRLGLFEGGEEHLDLAEARILLGALAGLVDAAAPEVGSQHAAPLRDGVQVLQRAFRAAQVETGAAPDAPGAGPGEKYTGPVV